jgi:hypothetical protein
LPGGGGAAVLPVLPVLPALTVLPTEKCRFTGNESAGAGSHAEIIMPSRPS